MISVICKCNIYHGQYLYVFELYESFIENAILALKMQESVAKNVIQEKCINFSLKYHLFCLIIAYISTTFFWI